MGYIDRKGKLVIKPQFDTAEDFYEGRAMVSINRQNGYINPAGEIVIPTEYSGVPRYFAEGRVAVCQRKAKRWLAGYLDRDGGVVTELKYLLAADFSEGLALVQTDAKRFAYIDRHGEEQFVLDASIVCSRDFHDGLAMVEVKGKKITAGYIDMSGQVVIPPGFADARDFAERLAPVQVGKSGWGYIDTNGEMRIKPTYEWAGSFSGGVAAVKLPDQHGLALIGRDGNIVAQTACEFIKEFAEGLAAASVQGKGKGAGLVTGYINAAGEMVIRPRFMEADPFRYGLASVMFEGGRTAYIDHAGKTVWAER